jgi:hypothetical protein
MCQPQVGMIGTSPVAGGLATRTLDENEAIEAQRFNWGLRFSGYVARSFFRKNDVRGDRPSR